MANKVKEQPSKTLFDYLKKNIDKNVVTHVVTVTLLPNNTAEVHLQPANAEGETPTFFVKDNKVAKTVEELNNL